jgi:hypothetical protein
MVKSLQEHDVQGAISIDEDSVKLDILDDGANYERIPPRLWYKVWVVTAVKGDGHLRSSQFSLYFTRILSLLALFIRFNV